MKVCFLGCGNIAQAIIDGLLKSGISSSDIACIERNEQRVVSLRMQNLKIIELENLASMDFDLIATISGWGKVISQFNNAETFYVNNDGTVSYTNPGIGVMFLPSGLAYFSSSAGSVPVYSNLIFKFKLYTHK